MKSLHAENLPILPEPLEAVGRTSPHEPVEVCTDRASAAAPLEKKDPGSEGSGRSLGAVAAAFGAWIVAGRASSWLASAMVHASAVLLLSLFMFSQPGKGPQLWLEGTFEPEPPETINLDESVLSELGGEINAPREQATTLSAAGNLASTSIVSPPHLENLSTSSGLLSPQMSVESIEHPLASKGGGLDGRGSDNRRRLALGSGGTAASESAVERGLAWLAAHQTGDGSWRFDLRQSPQCDGACRNSGIIESTTASTGLALLCFLGAGYTQHEGPYQQEVADGLYYLIDRMVLTSVGGDLRDTSMLDKLGEGIPNFRKSGDMYSHGIATLALCEAYAMTRDENLAQPAQEAVNFIVYAQHEKGGWRYVPKQPGDTTVSGWQVTALKSALLGKLKVPREVWYRASEFFDSVQDDRGATYGYKTPSKTRRSTSVVGLFSRMVLGWPHEHPPLRKGMAKIAKQMPRQNHMYFNYYASQALHHVGGPGWERWNPRMREYLVTTQATRGHETGSWYFDEEWSDRGGRLYTTTLAILTLEVYYRYMPMYRETFINEAP